MNILTRLWQRKALVGLVTVVLVGAGYYAYARGKTTSAAPRYVTAQVTRGTLSVSLSGTGQVAVSSQLDLKPKASGDVVKVFVTQGQKVTAGQVLIQLNTRDADKAIRDAQTNIESAKLALLKLQQPADDLSLLQAQNALVQAQAGKQKATDVLAQDYESGFNTVTSTFLNLPTIMVGLQDTLLGTSLGTAGQTNKDYYIDALKLIDNKVYQYADDTNQSYQAARMVYDANFQHYKVTDRSAPPATIEALLTETYTTTQAIAQAVKDANNLIQFYNDTLTQRSLKPNPGAATYLTNLTTYASQTNSALTNVLSARTTLQTDKDALVADDQSIAEKTASLTKLKAGTDPLDIQSQQLAITQRENALRDAEEALANYTVRAPFGGVVAAVTTRVGDTVSTGTSLGTLITTERLADVTLNEVDVAKVKLGLKAVLTFDAIPDLSLSGQVDDIAALGTVSQGVVSYDVKIGFDSQDDRIKDGMSVAAAIITDVKQDVLMVPNAAVKTQGTAGSYVQVMVNGAPERRPVEVGAANDTETEVSGNISEGDEVVTQTITSTTTSSTTNTQQRGGVGGGLFGGGTFRIGTGGPGR